MPDANTLSSELLDGSHTAFVLLDGTDHIAWINTAAENLMLTSASSARGLSVTRLFTYPDQQSDFSRARHTQQRILRHELLVEHPGARESLLDLVITPWRDGALLLELVASGSRFSPQRHLDQQQQQSTALLKNLAHEIKNPLGGIRGAAQLVARQASGEQIDEYTRVIIDETDRLSALIDNLLAPARQPVRNWCNVHQVLDNVAMLLGAQSDATVELLRDFDVSVPEVWIDRHHLQQVLINLARNAIEAIDDNGQIVFLTRIRRNVVIEGMPHSTVVSVGVEDNGPGIQHDQIADIFLPMVTTRATGNGLGLAISRELVKLNGGSLQCTSRANPTRFEILIPLTGESDNDV